MKFSALIIGLGNIGMGYDLESALDTRMSHTGACVSHDSISEIYGVDPDSERRKLFETTTKSKAFSNIKKFSATCANIDICIISTPTSLREQIVKECILLTPKAILLEKPIAMTLKEASVIKEMCAEKGISLYVNYFRLFDPEFKKLKKQIKDDEFGSICGGGCYFSGSVLNIASHYISLLIDFFGEPEKVTTVCSEQSKESFILDFKEFRFNFNAVNTEYATGEMELWFPEHKIKLENNCMDIEFSNCKPDPLFPEYKSLKSDKRISADLNNYQYNVLDSLVSDIVNDRYDSLSIDNAFKTLEICRKIN